jgi:hypothetical protein
MQNEKNRKKEPAAFHIKIKMKHHGEITESHNGKGSTEPAPLKVFWT